MLRLPQLLFVRDNAHHDKEMDDTEDIKRGRDDKGLSLYCDLDNKGEVLISPKGDIEVDDTLSSG